MKETSGDYLTRQYTPISDSSKRGSFDLLIKVCMANATMNTQLGIGHHTYLHSCVVTVQLYEDGRMSRHIRQWEVGSTAEWRGPFGTFTYKPNQVQDCITVEPH